MSSTKKLILSQIVFAAFVSAVFSSSAFAATPKCAFGDDVFALKKAKRFVTRGSFGTFKLNRQKDPINSLLWVYVTQIKDSVTGKEYQMNLTNDDAYDGGNSTGWIEDVSKARDGIDDVKPSELKGTGAVVAEIFDSSISCSQEIK